MFSWPRKDAEAGRTLKLRIDPPTKEKRTCEYLREKMLDTGNQENKRRTCQMTSNTEVSFFRRLEKKTDEKKPHQTRNSYQLWCQGSGWMWNALIHQLRQDLRCNTFIAQVFLEHMEYQSAWYVWAEGSKNGKGESTDVCMVSRPWGHFKKANRFKVECWFILVDKILQIIIIIMNNNNECQW